MTIDIHRGHSLPDRTPIQSAPAALVEWAEAAGAAHRLVAPLVSTDFVPAHFRPKGNSDDAVRSAQAAATAAVLYGAEAGLSPMQALQGIYVISGRPALYSRTMLAITLSAGHEVWTEESTDTRAVVCGRRRGSSNSERVVVTMDQARKAGWTNNKKYVSEPAVMLLARAQSQVCRRIAPDALVGMAYSAEELEDENAPAVTVQRGAAKAVQRKAAPKPAPVIDEPELDDMTAEEYSGHDDAAPEPATTESDADADSPITAPQLTKLHAAMNAEGIKERSEALAFLKTRTGRDVESSKDLTKDEASQVIDWLENSQ